jgi:hypothetical protein
MDFLETKDVYIDIYKVVMVFKQTSQRIDHDKSNLIN